jgi:uncharacterized protein with HEPN domain
MQMRDAAQDALFFVEGLSKTDFEVDAKTQNAVAMALVRIGTNAARIDIEAPEVMLEVPAIEWPLMRGMRNRIARDYERLDMDVIWSTVQIDIPILVKQLNLAIG